MSEDKNDGSNGEGERIDFSDVLEGEASAADNPKPDPLGLLKLLIPASDPLNIWHDDDTLDLELVAASFAARIRERCPLAYDEWDDETLTRGVVKHYPSYASMVEPELRPADLDFSKQPSQREDSFEFMLPALLLPDSPELLTAKINSKSAARVLHEKLELLAGKSAFGEDRADQWEKIRAAMVSDPEFQVVESLALNQFTEHLHTISLYALDVAVGYSLAWALLAILERAGGNALRADFVQGTLNAGINGMVERVFSLRSAIEKALDERAAQSSDETSDDES